jgi:hypothetical protein
MDEFISINDKVGLVDGVIDLQRVRQMFEKHSGLR